jgi:hypothetical protein
MTNQLIICYRCIYDSNTSGISFDNEGVCNYCKQIENLEKDMGVLVNFPDKEKLKESL